MARNKIEELKSEKDGLDVLPDLYRYAVEGVEAIPADDLERLKWYGLFHRKATPGYFMLRMRIPNGVLTSEQIAAVGEIANRLRARRRRHHDAPEHPAALDHHRGRSVGVAAPRRGGPQLAAERHGQRPQRGRLPDRRPRRRRAARCARAGRSAATGDHRRQALQQPAAQVQPLDQRLPRGLRARADPRPLVRARHPRGGRTRDRRLQRARRRRARRDAAGAGAAARRLRRARGRRGPSRSRSSRRSATTGRASSASRRGSRCCSPSGASSASARAVAGRLGNARSPAPAKRRPGSMAATTSESPNSASRGATSSAASCPSGA